HRGPRKRRRSNPDCSPRKLPDPQGFYRQRRAQVSKSDPLLRACPPKTRFACRWDDGSCPRSNRKIPTAVRHRQHRTYNNRRPDFREQTQAAAEFCRRTFPPFPCLSPANRCDQSNAFSCSDSQSHRLAIQLLVIAKVGRAVLCVPIAIHGAHSPRRASCMTCPTKTPTGPIPLQTAPKSVSVFLSWLPATTSDRSLTPYPTRNVPASSAYWEFAG